MEQDNIAVNIYSDESRHLINQGDFMVIGSVWCSKLTQRALNDKVTLLKRHHNISKHREIKWTKVSPAKLEYYRDLIELFFAEEGLNFRAIVVPTNGLRHQDFDQTEDEFYYKMQYQMISNVARKYSGRFKIYLDYKDSWSNFRTKRLKAFLEAKFDSANNTFSAQPIRSTESIPMQFADLLIGAVSYVNNVDSVSHSKGDIAKLIEERAGQRLNEQTPFGVDKFNIFKWKPQG